MTTAATGAQLYGERQNTCLTMAFAPQGVGSPGRPGLS